MKNLFMENSEKNITYTITQNLFSKFPKLMCLFKLEDLYYKIISNKINYNNINNTHT